MTIGSTTRHFWLALGLVVATLVVFGSLTSAQFIVYDDHQYVVDNPALQDGLTMESIRWAFTTGYAAMWCPLSWISHLLDVELYGLHAGGHHRTSVILHALNALLLFVALRRLTGTTYRSAAVAGLFALHPLHVQSVAWVAERKDVLSTTFGFLALWFYARHAERPTVGRYALVALALTLGLMAKPMLVTLPFVLLLLDGWPLERLQGNLRWALLEKVPLLALAAASVGITIFVQRGDKALTSFDVLPLSLRAANSVVSYARYLGKTVWPADLAIFYPYPSYWSVAAVAGSVALLVILTALAVRQRRQRPYLLMGWLWFIGTLIPVIGLVQTGSHAMADRFTYVPLVGLFVVAVWATVELARAWRVPGTLVVGMTAVVLVTLAMAARREASYWHDSVTIFSRALEATADNSETRFNLGTALQRAGRFEEAEEQFRTGLRMNPRDSRIYNSLGALVQNMGRTDDAINEYRLALQADGSHLGARMNLAVTLFENGRRDEAIAEFREAVRLNNGSALAHYKLGVALAQMGRLTDAEEPLRRAVEIQPDWAEAWNELGTTLGRQGRVAEAVPCFAEAVRLNPRLDAASRNLERARARQASQR
jgi:tetratricopeptide (TPR) repeat protein